MMKQWVADVTRYPVSKEQDNLFAFIPIENAGMADETLVVGLALITTPEGIREKGDLIGAIHLDGQEELEKWIEAYPKQYELLKEAQ